MKSTIDLAREADIFSVNVFEPGVFEDALETFRALCIQEEHKRLMGVDVEPTMEIGENESIMCHTLDLGTKLYDATRLAATALRAKAERDKELMGVDVEPVAWLGPNGNATQIPFSKWYKGYVNLHTADQLAATALRAEQRGREEERKKWAKYLLDNFGLEIE